MSEQFTVAGQSIPTITTAYGGFLILWGVVVSQLSDSNSITSYFPSLLGIPLLISGIMSTKIPEKKEVMDAHRCYIWSALRFGRNSILHGNV